MLSPLIPGSRLAKLLVYTLRERKDLLGLYLRSLPVQLVAQISAACGQAVGLLFGLGNAETVFLHL